MTPPSDKRKGALPPSDLTRLAQRDIGKVARLFRDSGFRYRVFDSETGEHQVVDPVRPLPPLDHVPPVWPPPFEDGAEAAPVTFVPRAAGSPAAAPAESPAMRPGATRSPGESVGALRANARAEEIFRSAADGVPRGAAATAAAGSVIGAAAAELAASERGRGQEVPMVSSKKGQAAPVERAAGRVVAFPGKPASAVSNEAPASLERVAGPSVAAIIGKLMQPPPAPPPREPGSTAAVLRRILEKRSES